MIDTNFELNSHRHTQQCARQNSYTRIAAMSTRERAMLTEPERDVWLSESARQIRQQNQQLNPT